tara:strand:+ start:51 stop:1088 length:1038 start_codon:yes stop_codon:yes gene_type:complete
MKKILLSIIALSFLMSEIQFSGDARFRPRYDIKKYGDGETSDTADLYYMYRARLNMKADIGEGWFFNSKLGINQISGHAKLGQVFEDETISYTYKPTISFMELYFGQMKDDWGFWAGIFPLKYNPSLDLHFYDNKLVDIPFVLLSNGAIGGFAGYKTLMGHKLNWFLSVDSNVVERTEPVEGDLVDDCDDFTLGMDASLTFGSVSVTPRFLTSFGGTEDDIYPTTLGGDILLPNIAGFDSGISYYMSTNGEESDEGYYEADHMRFSLSRSINDGKLKFFYDMASKDDDSISYIWLSYTHTCYKGDMGEVTMAPTFRLQTGKGAGGEFDEDYSRSKIELTTQIKFK